MKVQKKVSVQGDFAKVGEDIKDGDIITILDGGTILAGDFGDRHVFKIKTGNGEKILSFNQTSMNNLIDALGDETDKWAGKEVKVFTVKQMINNKLRNVVYLTSKGWIMTEDGQFMPGIAKESDEIEYPEEE